MKKIILSFCILLPILFTLLLSCASGNKAYNDCDEKCEYNRRYCFEACGGPDRAGFTFDMKDKGKAKPYSCQERCDKTADSCKSNCESVK